LYNLPKEGIEIQYLNRRKTLKYPLITAVTISTVIPFVEPKLRQVYRS